MEDDIKKKIKHGEHLTFTDMLVGGFKANAAKDEVTGRDVYPREAYLTQKAKERKDEADAAAREAARKRKQSGS
jgi:hypothetical protein